MFKRKETIYILLFNITLNTSFPAISYTVRLLTFSHPIQPGIDDQVKSEAFV